MGGPPQSRPARPASLPGHVRLDDVIGRGGSATVWRARDRRDGRPVAVKVIVLGDGPDGAARRDRFEREARALARLTGRPGILVARELGVGDDGLAWLVTDLLPGGSLADRMAGAGASGLTAAEVLPVGIAVAGALADAHGRGVVHGDLSPSNVLVDGAGRAVLADFGSALVQVGDGDAGLTPAFAAPERLGGGAPTPASDVFGLGAVLWAASTGRPPDDGATTGLAVDAAGPPRGLAEVLRACCDPSPGARPTATEVRRRLDRERRRRGGLRQR